MDAEVKEMKKETKTGKQKEERAGIAYVFSSFNNTISL